MLVGETSPAVLGVAADKAPGLAGPQIELCLHAGHGINLSSEGRDEERVHYGVGRDAQAYGSSTWEPDFVDGRDPQLRIDEEPLPVLGDDLDVERFVGRLERLIGIECVGVEPDVD